MNVYELAGQIATPEYVAMRITECEANLCRADIYFTVTMVLLAVMVVIAIAMSVIARRTHSETPIAVACFSGFLACIFAFLAFAFGSGIADAMKELQLLTNNPEVLIVNELAQMD